MTARRDLAIATAAAEQAIATLFAPMAADIQASVTRHAVNGRITAASRVAILRDVDAILNAAYPARSGDDAAVGRLIERQCRAVRMKPIDAAVAQMRTALVGESELLAAMGVPDASS